jgi:hypothetical protein
VPGVISGPPDTLPRETGRQAYKALLAVGLVAALLMLSAIAGLAYGGYFSNLFTSAAGRQSALKSESPATPADLSVATSTADSAGVAEQEGDKAAASEEKREAPAESSSLPAPEPRAAVQPGRPDTTKLRQQLRQANQGKVAKRKISKSSSPAKSRKAKARRGFSKLRFW